MKRALITGSGGFVGRHFATHLIENGWRVTCYDLKTKMDMLDGIQTGRTYDLVIHAAARAPHRRGIDEVHASFPYNVMLDGALFEWAIRTKQRHVVYLSSSAVYPARLQNIGFAENFQPLHEDEVELGEPFDDYGRAKLIGERMTQRAREAGVRVTVTRTFSGYGTDQSPDFPFRAFVDRAQRAENPFIIWGSATQVRDWIHIDDIVEATMTLVEADVIEPVNICTGTGTSMQELARLVCGAGGYSPTYAIDVDAPLGVHYRVGDPTRLNTYYTPKITLEEGVARAFEE